MVLLHAVSLLGAPSPLHVRSLKTRQYPRRVPENQQHNCSLSAANIHTLLYDGRHPLVTMCLTTLTMPCAWPRDAGMQVTPDYVLGVRGFDLESVESELNSTLQ
jgi:hypothetical protein